MAIKLNVQIIGAEQLARKFQKASQRMSQVMRDKMSIVVMGLKGQIQEKMSGKVLKVRTGRLRSSVTTRVEMQGKDILGKVGSNVVYAPVHEYGATITAKKGEYLRFQVEGHWVSVKSVKIPRRPIWEPTLKENREKINALFRQALYEVLR